MAEPPQNPALPSELPVVPLREAVVLPPGGESLPFDIDVAGDGELTRIAPDGSIWSFGSGRLVRSTSAADQTHADGMTSARFTLVGNRPFLLDEGRRRVRFDTGDWIDVPVDVDPSEVVLQEPGPRADCGWMAVDDELWCVGSDGIVLQSTIEGLGADGADRLGIADDAAALVLVYPHDGRLHVPLTVRGGGLRTHTGQVRVGLPVFQFLVDGVCRIRARRQLFLQHGQFFFEPGQRLLAQFGWLPFL